MSVGAHKRKSTYPFPDDWKVSRKVVDILERQLRKGVTISRDYDVPYLAGYSRDGKTIYIDRFFPRVLEHMGKKIDVTKYLLMHERIEKALIDALGLDYENAHQVAERTEESAVASDGIDLRWYDAAMNREIAKIGARKSYDRCPPDLDMTPMVDEDDHKTIARMTFAKAA